MDHHQVSQIAATGTPPLSPVKYCPPKLIDIAARTSVGLNCESGSGASWSCVIGTNPGMGCGNSR